ncbi:hypothetical protein BX666DRAFT_1848575 [Dichotomocladium elegans]|nr:hypothetical protein BX666DRAFT_1848575 [Dichotomocladium elegans]
MFLLALAVVILYLVPLFAINVYVTVVEGDLPLILTCPHGGLLKPRSIPDRTPTPGTVLINDGYTIDTTFAIASALSTLHDGSRQPYLVVCNVARIKVDVNRRMDEGTDSKEGGIAWKAYHDSLQTLIKSALLRYGYVLLLDIHGHGADHGKVELGYLLRKDELASMRDPDKMNSAVLTRSSIRHLAHRTAIPAPHELLRGNGSMGQLMEKAHRQIRTMPSPSHLYPEEHERYFRGGYTTQVYAAVTGLDVIQIELPRHLRFTPQGRHNAATAIAEAATLLMDQHYCHPGLSRQQFPIQPKL